MLASDVFLLDQAMHQRFLTCLQILMYVWIVQLRNPKQISCSIFCRKKRQCSAKDLLVLSSACLPVNLVASISLRVYFLLFQPSEAWLCTSQVSLRNLRVTTTASRWPRSSLFLVIKQTVIRDAVRSQPIKKYAAAGLRTASKRSNSS